MLVFLRYGSLKKIIINKHNKSLKIKSHRGNLDFVLLVFNISFNKKKLEYFFSRGVGGYNFTIKNIMGNESKPINAKVFPKFIVFIMLSKFLII